MNEWIQFAGIIVTILGSSWFVWSEMKGIETKLDQKIEQQSQRTDKLYEMFIDLLKEGRK